jgi:hypothetical protein
VVYWRRTYLNLITTAVCNPNNEKPSDDLEVIILDTMYFPVDAENNATKMLIIIASCYVVLTAIGLLWIKDIDIKQLAMQVVQPENKQEYFINKMMSIKNTTKSKKCGRKRVKGSRLDKID